MPENTDTDHAAPTTLPEDVPEDVPGTRPDPLEPAPAAERESHADIARRFLHRRSDASDPQLSPDGARVAHVVATCDVDANTTTTRVWLDGAPTTAGPHDGQPRWSPDGRFLAFTSRRGEHEGDATLHVLPVGGPGEVRTICTRPEAIGDLAWSPDGRWLAFTSRTRDERYDTDDPRAQAPRRIEHYFSRLNGEGWVFDRPRHVYVIAADGTEPSPRNLTPGEYEHGGLSWLADSSGLVTAGSRHDSWDVDRTNDLFVVPLEGEITPLTGQTGSYSTPSVSPDGEHLAFFGFDDPHIMPQNRRVGVMRIDGSERRWISDGLDRTFQPLACPQAPRWIDDRSIAAAAEDRGDVTLYRLTLDGDGPEPLTGGRLTITGHDGTGDVLVTTVSTVDRGSEVEIDRGSEHSRLTSVGMTGQGWERFAVPCTDGSDEIDAWIMRPAHFDPDATYPVLLNVHGGPFTQYGESFFDEAQIQAAAGFVVLMSNPRGGSGRHTGWGQAITGPKHAEVPGTGWGSVDVDDVLAVLDAALERYPFCDRGRVGMLGGSYGGYMATLLAARHGDRFGAVCSERAANNLLSMEWSSDIASAFRSQHGVDAYDDPDEYLRMSPSVLARDIHVPFLIIHSEDDFRCPIVQAEQLWATLKWLGRDVTFYRFPGENHELSRSGSPVHRRQRAEIILDFFADRLGTARPGAD